MITWQQAVKNAIHRYSLRHATKDIERQRLIGEELAQIIHDTQALGDTPAQTLSRVLQELRDEGFLYFTSKGNYLLVDAPIQVELEDLPDDALDFALQHQKLMLGIVPTDDPLSVVRQRKGQERIRHHTLKNYHHACAFCDVKQNDLLVAGHVARWADDPENRGNLANIICMCKFHDTLFERGYFSLSDDYKILKKMGGSSRIVRWILDNTTEFSLPAGFPPDPVLLQKHRNRTGF